jgi:hypothetical protein
VQGITGRSCLLAVQLANDAKQSPISAGDNTETIKRYIFNSC